MGKKEILEGGRQKFLGRAAKVFGTGGKSFWDGRQKFLGRAKGMAFPEAARQKLLEDGPNKKCIWAGLNARRRESSSGA
jgi:hypothetical protein